MFIKKWEKILTSTESAVAETELILNDTTEIEYSAANASEISVYGKDDTLYFADTLTHGHTFFVRSGNLYAIVSTSDLIESVDIPVSNTPLKLTVNGSMTIRMSEVK